MTISRCWSSLLSDGPCPTSCSDCSAGASPTGVDNHVERSPSNIRVDFPIYGASRSLRTTIFQRAAGGLIFRAGKKQERVVVRALNDVSLRLEDNDRLGLIGHN